MVIMYAYVRTSPQENIIYCRKKHLLRPLLNLATHMVFICNREILVYVPAGLYYRCIKNNKEP